MDEQPGAVDRVDDPDRGVAAEGGQHGRIGVHGLLADHDGAGEQRRERGGEVFLGEPVGDGHQVVRPVLLDDLAGGQLPEPRHDLGRGRLADRLFDLGHLELVQQIFDHVSIEPRVTDSGDVRHGDVSRT